MLNRFVLNAKTIINVFVKFILRPFRFFICKRIFRSINIKDINQSLDILISSKKSVARFGDGEIDLIRGKSIKFQNHNLIIEKKLSDIIKNDDSNIWTCIPFFYPEYKRLRTKVRNFWIDYLYQNRKLFYSYLKKGKLYLSSNISRPYILYKDKNFSKDFFDKWKTLWEHENILIVEGSMTRMGVDNDLFENAKSVIRVLCPQKNAFDKYDEILSAAEEHGKNRLILIALGPTATVLAYELSKKGYWAIDIGHIDVEYEWFLAKTNVRINIKNKYVNEVEGVSIIDKSFDKTHDNYLNEIVSRIF